MNFTEYPDDYTHGIPIPYTAPVGLTWSQKLNDEMASAIKDANPMLWATQYDQNPTVETGEIFHADWWQFYDVYDPINSEIQLDTGARIKIRSKAIYADTAMKTAERHDFSVFELFASLINGHIALLDLERGKWEAPELLERFDAFVGRHSFKTQVINMGVRTVKVEDKASGTGLIQSSKWNVEGIPRDKDKVSRAKSCVPHIKLGKVWLPRGVPWLVEYVREFTAFNSEMTHKHDDQIDPTLDAIDDLIIGNKAIGYGGVI